MNQFGCDREASMNDKWMEFSIRIQSIAQAGIQYGKDKYECDVAAKPQFWV